MTSIATSTTMEMWLKTSGKAFRFPILPAEITVENSAIINRVNIVNKGEVPVFGGVNLASIQINSFFPATEYDFCKYTGFPSPYECVKIMEDWRKKGQDIRFIVTGTDINIPVIIESFSYGEVAGSRDVEYSLNLKEHKSVTIQQVATTSKPNNGNTNTRPSNPPATPKTHKVVKGDCLWDIAQKYLGKCSRYPEIKKANWDKYPSLKQNNIIYTYMTLVIPS